MKKQVRLTYFLRKVLTQGIPVTLKAFCNNDAGQSNGLKQSRRLIKDPIHGTIELDPVLAVIIDTPQFQRLRNIKQLGGCYWVYPGGSHSRFEHSIGTSYLCGKFITILKEKHPHLITDMDVLCIKVAGLCHDMGHGPFSHAFYNQYRKLVAPQSMWTHEEQSCKMFNYMIAENEKVREAFETEKIGEKEKNLVKDLLIGKDPLKCNNGSIRETDGKKHCFLYEIVSNARNGIDCDKFDYLMRDSYHIGWKCNFDCMRYFQTTDIIPIDNNYQLCVRDKEQFALYQLFQLRYDLHHQVCQHKTTRAIEAMICDALKFVDKELKIFESINDPAAFTYLTDGIFDEIARERPKDFKTLSYSKNMEKAKEVINRIHTRNLYRLCGEVTIPECSEESKKGTEKDMNEEDSLKIFILNKIKKDKDFLVTEQDFYVDEVRMAYGKGNQDPVDSVTFFNKSGKISKMGKEHISNILPRNFLDHKIRVYCKPDDQAKRDQIRDSFEDWCKLRKHPQPRILDDTGNEGDYMNARKKQKLSEYASNDEIEME